MAKPYPQHASQPESEDQTDDDAARPGFAEDLEPFAEDPLAIAEARIAELEVERDAMRERLMRALADAENSRKRAEKNRRDGLLYGGAKLSRDMLPVYDHLSRALDAANDDVRAAASGLVNGVELTLRELTNILEKHGVERICPEPGEMFDPHLHQAMFEAPVPDFSAGQIIQVMTSGFRLHEQLLRPAQVGVSSSPAS